MLRFPLLTVAVCVLMFLGCPDAGAEGPFEVRSVARFDEPWALAFLPDGRVLVTEKKGAVHVVESDTGRKRRLRGVPDVAYGGQGGLGDVAVHPDFETNGLVYLSYAEAGIGGTRGAAVARGRLEFDDRGRGALRDLEVIWRQYPKVLGAGHYGHRLLFDKRWLPLDFFWGSAEVHAGAGHAVQHREDPSPARRRSCPGG